MQTIKLLNILLLWIFFQANAQEYPVSAISDSLTKNAHAVVRYREDFFEQSDLNNGTYKVIKAITILNEKGKSYGNIVIPIDKFWDIKSFSAVVVDAAGKTIKKIDKKDLTTTAYSSHMATDDKYSYYQYQPVRYPYTIRYEYEMKLKNGIFAYPRFMPIPGYDVSVEYARYHIRVPSDMPIRYKVERMPDGQFNTRKAGGNTIYEWSVSDIKAIEDEPYSPDFLDIVPVVYLAPTRFCMEQQCGDMADWNSLGIWLNQLMTGREEISPPLKEKIVALTADADTDKEKVQRIYQYLQSTTRYVSIQLGIGGFQPINAAIVEKTGYGDCKALSNYMKAMLASVGIPSLYTVISTEHADLYTDHASLGQMNHVILAVPLTTDTLWLECTNQVIPFNYIHDDIAGHQCLLITPEGGKLCRVKEQTGIANNKTLYLQAKIDETGNGKAIIREGYKLSAYESMQKFIHSMSREEQINTLTKNLPISKVTITGLQVLTNETETPDLQVNYQADIKQFANKSGNRLFVPFSSLHHFAIANMKSTRKQDIVITDGIMRTDTLQIEVPPGYTLETIPKPVTLSSMFGDYSLDIHMEDNRMQLIQKIYLKKGRYPASAADEFRNFFKDMDKESARRAVFKQN